MTFNIPVLYGSVRSERQGIKAARFMVKKLEERGHEVTLLDPVEYKLPFLDKMYKEYQPGTAPEPLETIASIINDADGFLLVSGEYNHAVPPTLKNILDHFQREYSFKPSAIATYSAGPFGGVRAAVHLRDIMAELGAPSISTAFPISTVQESFDDNGNPVDEAYDRRIKRFLDEFEWYLRAFKNERLKGTPY